jgi:hypothetical protein
MRVAYLLGKPDRQTDRQTDMNGPISCSSLTLERERLQQWQEILYIRGIQTFRHAGHIRLRLTGR